MGFLKEWYDEAKDEVKQVVSDPIPTLSDWATKPITLTIDSAKEGYSQIAPQVANLTGSAQGFASEVKKSPELFNLATQGLGIGGLAQQAMGFLDRKESDIVSPQSGRVSSLDQQYASNVGSSIFGNSTIWILMAGAIGVFILIFMFKKK